VGGACDEEGTVAYRERGEGAGVYRGHASGAEAAPGEDPYGAYMGEDDEWEGTEAPKEESGKRIRSDKRQGNGASAGVGLEVQFQGKVRGRLFLYRTGTAQCRATSWHLVP